MNNQPERAVNGDKKSRREYNLARIVTTIIILAVVGGIMLLSSVKASIAVDNGVETLSVQGTFMNDRVPLSDITEVKLLDEWRAGSRVNGVNTIKTEAGHFKNVEAGDYRLAIWKTTSLFIKVTHTGGVLVFNLKDEAATRAFYEELSAKFN